MLNIHDKTNALNEMLEFVGKYQYNRKRMTKPKISGTVQPM